MEYGAPKMYDYKNYFKSHVMFTKIRTQFSTQVKQSYLRNSLNSHVFLLNKPLNHLALRKNTNVHYNTQKTLALNFKRRRFFPTIRTLKGENYIFLSLGMLSKFFNKNKSFLKTKTMYLLLMSFFRKILLFSSLTSLILTISKTPVYLKEMLTTLNSPVTKIYKHPFDDIDINEKVLINPFKFSFILFFNNKPFGQLKRKKKGRLKRKISKKLTLINKLMD